MPSRRTYRDKAVVPEKGGEGICGGDKEDSLAEYSRYIGMSVSQGLNAIGCQKVSLGIIIFTNTPLGI